MSFESEVVVDPEAPGSSGSADTPKDAMVEFQADKRRKLGKFLSDPTDPVDLNKNKHAKGMSIATMSTQAPDDASHIERAMSDSGRSEATVATQPWGDMPLNAADILGSDIWLGDIPDGNAAIESGEHNCKRLTAQSLQALEGELKTVVEEKSARQQTKSEESDFSALKKKIVSAWRHSEQLARLASSPPRLT